MNKLIVIVQNIINKEVTKQRCEKKTVFDKIDFFFIERLKNLRLNFQRLKMFSKYLYQHLLNIT